jgi:hypothetical protein
LLVASVGVAGVVADGFVVVDGVDVSGVAALETPDAVVAFADVVGAGALGGVTLDAMAALAAAAVVAAAAPVVASAVGMVMVVAAVALACGVCWLTAAVVVVAI